MCEHCLIEPKPARLTFTSDSGHYTINYQSCAACQQRCALVQSAYKRHVQEEAASGDCEAEYTEDVQYVHECSQCQHVIATHQYCFSVLGSEQLHTMNCQLCGSGRYECDVRHQTVRAAEDAYVHEHKEPYPSTDIQSCIPASFRPQPALVGEQASRMIGDPLLRSRVAAAMAQVPSSDSNHHDNEWD